jgi:rhodanese-related sulfurtransferase
MRRVNLILLILALLLIMSLLAACGSSAESAQTGTSKLTEVSEVPRITAEELKQRLDDGEDILIIDTRIGSRQYELSHIPGAIKKPRSLDDVAHDQAIVAYCTDPSEASSAGQALGLYGQGFSDVAVLSGGMNSWVEAGYPMEGSQAEE